MASNNIKFVKLVRAGETLSLKSALLGVAALALTATGALADQLLGEHGGVGIYDTFVHVDVRAKKSRFDYRSKK